MPVMSVRGIFHFVISILCVTPSIAQPAPTITIESPRGAFYRGEEFLLRIHCEGGEPMPEGSKLKLSLGDVIQHARDIKSLPTTESFRISSLALKVGAYKLDVTLNRPKARLRMFQSKS